MHPAPAARRDASGVVTAGLLVETSLGPLSVDLFGADCPALTANFVNLCRAQLWNGAVVTEVIPDVAVFFSHAADPVLDRALRTALGDHSGQPTLWSLVPRLPAASPNGTAAASTSDVIAQEEEALRGAMRQEARACKRRRCTGLAKRRGKDSKERYEPAFEATTPGTAGASPCAVCRAGSLLVDMGSIAASPSSLAAGPTHSSATPRFGLTLTGRAMEYLDQQYVAIGCVRDGGEALLRRLRRLPLRQRDTAEGAEAAATSNTDVTAPGPGQDCVAGRPAPSWPRPIRLMRVRRISVLPTAGTDAYSAVPPSAWWGAASLAVDASTVQRQAQQRTRLATALLEAGCFRWWAPAAAVRRGQERLVELVRRSLVERGYAAPVCRPTTVAEATAYLSHPGTTAAAAAVPAPLVVLAAPRAEDRSTDVGGAAVELVGNPHYTGDMLDSGDDDDAGIGGGGGGVSALSAKQLEERRKIFMHQHQEKANETLSLMLNVLNGVADVRGDIKPPENVLFVCRLNPVTTGDGLAVCFAQFGRVTSAEVIQDPRTKQSLCYGFVEFESVEACFRGFQKMDRALIDDARIHVDFSQSVSKLWAQRQRELRKRDRVV